MSQRFRISDRLKSQSAEQLVIMAGAITGLTNNPAFPAQTVGLKINRTGKSCNSHDTI